MSSENRILVANVEDADYLEVFTPKRIAYMREFEEEGEEDLTPEVALASSLEGSLDKSTELFRYPDTDSE
jgi:hypothetical protein